MEPFFAFYVGPFYILCTQLILLICLRRSRWSWAINTLAARSHAPGKGFQNPYALLKFCTINFYKAPMAVQSLRLRAHGFQKAMWSCFMVRCSDYFSKEHTMSLSLCTFLKGREQVSKVPISGFCATLYYPAYVICPNSNTSVTSSSF